MTTPEAAPPTRASEAEFEEREITAADGVNLWLRQWSPAGDGETRAWLLFLHGRGGHGGRYAELAEHLARRGIAMWALDYRGFGRAGGIRGGVRRFADYFLDVDVGLGALAEQVPDGAAVFLGGHSLGGLISVRHVQERGSDLALSVRGMPLSSPFFGMLEPPSAVTQLLLGLAARLSPDKRKHSDGRRLTRDDTEHQRSCEDPLRTPFYTIGWATEMFAAQRVALAQASRFSLPVLILQGAEDPVVSVQDSQHFHDVATSPDKTFRNLDGMLHEVFHELPAERSAAMEEWAEWILARA